MHAKAFLVVAACGLAVSGSSLTVLAAEPAGRQVAAAAAGIDREAPLPTDPRLVTGELPNGMRYIVLKHAVPPGRASLWLHISTGSLNETDAQRGLAHYLEHLAFNGSENFPPGSVVKFFESLGLTFGQHQNAFTSFDQTTYQIAVPDAQPETIDKAMLFFADVAGRLSLLEHEIDEERRVILEEKRARQGAQQRVQEYVIERLVPGSLIGERLPIGVEETLLSVQKPEFADYYGRWYVPSNMTLMVVADADPGMVVERIREHFAGGERAPTPEDQDPRVRAYTEDRGIVATDPELTDAGVSITKVRDPLPPATTVGAWRDELVDQIGVMAFNRRLGAKLNAGGTAYLSGEASASNLFNAMHLASAEARGKPERWRELLTELGTDVQRARLHGFTERELDDVKAAILAGAEQLVQRESTMPARLVLMRMNGRVAGGEPIMSAQQELDLLREVLPTLTAEEVSERFAEVFDTEAVTFVAELPSGVEGIPSESELVSMGREAFDVRPEPIAEEERPTALMEKLPEPGRVAESGVHEATGVTSAWLENGVRYHHRFMDYRKGDVTVVINLAAGSIQETPESRGVAEAAALAWNRPATSRLSSTQVRDLMTGEKAKVGGGAGTDTLTLTVSGPAEDIETGLQLAHLLLTDPRIEPAALEQWKQATLQAIERREKDPQAALAVAVAETMYPRGEARTQPLTAEQVRRVTLDQAQSWLGDALASAPIEVSVIGDIKEDRARELVARYLGSLPKRERISDRTLDDRRSLEKVNEPVTTERVVESQTPKAFVLSGFYGADLEDIEDVRALEMAARIIDTRMFEKIREKEQLAYSPFARHQAGATFPGFGNFLGGSSTDPDKTERFVAAVREIYDDFAANGPTPEELATARKQTANELSEEMKEPGYWTGRVSSLTYRGRSLDEIAGAPEAYERLTAEQIRDAFRRYYRPEAIRTVIVKPKAPAAGGGGQ